MITDRPRFEIRAIDHYVVSLACASLRLQLQLNTGLRRGIVSVTAPLRISETLLRCQTAVKNDLSKLTETLNAKRGCPTLRPSAIQYLHRMAQRSPRLATWGNRCIFFYCPVAPPQTHQPTPVRSLPFHIF